MLYRKARLGWSTGPSKFWVMSLTGATPSSTQSTATKIKPSDDGNLWYMRHFDDEGYFLKIVSNDPYDFATIETEYEFGNSSIFGDGAAPADFVEDGDYLYFSIGISETSNRYQLVTAKFLTSTMAAQWVFDPDNGAAQPRIYRDRIPCCIAKDSSGNVYFAAELNPAGSLNPQLSKYSSAGTYQWGYNIVTAGDSQHPALTSTGADGNIYVVADNTSGSNSEITVLKISTATPAIEWQRDIYRSGQTIAFTRTSIAVDPSGGVCVAWNTGTVAYLSKWNSTGTNLWNREFSNANAPSVGGVVVDGSDNVYVAVNDTVADVVEIIKYNSGGTLQWSKRITTPSGETAFLAQDMTIDSANGLIYVVMGNTNRSKDWVFCLSVDDEIDHGTGLTCIVDGTSVFTKANSTGVTEGAGGLSLTSDNDSNTSYTTITTATATNFTTDRDLI